MPFLRRVNGGGRVLLYEHLSGVLAGWVPSLGMADNKVLMRLPCKISDRTRELRC